MYRDSKKNKMIQLNKKLSSAEYRIIKPHFFQEKKLTNAKDFTYLQEGSSDKTAYCIYK